MVDKVLKIFNKEYSGLHEAAYLLGAFAIFSQILALFRDRLLAHFFGASQTLDIYYASFRIPDFIFVSIASLVAATVLIPFLIDRINQNGEEKEKAHIFLNSIFTTFAIIITSVSVLVFFLIPWLAQFIAPGFSGAAKDNFITLSRIMLISPILFGVSNLLGSIVQTFRRFFLFAMGPVLYNIGIIVGVIFFYPIWGIYGLAYGVLLGALMHLLIQLPAVIHSGFLPKFSLNIDFSEVKKVAILSLPRTLTLSSSHLVLIFIVAMASLINEGSITIFNLSFNLQSVPLSIIGVSYSVAAFPNLSRLFSAGNIDKFIEQIITATRHIIFWSFPIVSLFIVLRAQIVRTVLGSGEFSWTDTRLAAATLAVFSISIIAQSLILIFIRGYYAANNTKKPLIINVLSSVLIVVLAYSFIKLFNFYDPFKYFMESLLRIEDVEGSTIVMLALAYSIGSIVNVIWLWRSFQDDFKKITSSVKKVAFHSFSASVIMGFVAYQFLGVFDDLFDLNTFWGIFLQGAFSGLIGILFGIIILKLLKNKEIKVIEETLHKKFWKAKVLAPDKEGL